VAEEDPKSIPQVLVELKDLTVDYAKQETIDPLKGIGRFLAWGVAGSLLLGTGIILLSLALLRALQTETDDHLTGSLSWVPYAAAVALLLVLTVAAAMAITRTPKGER
jgi:hypothetical protein